MRSSPRGCYDTGRRTTAAGAFALSENNLYTTEAFYDYLSHLTDDGIMVFTRWGFEPPRESLRLVSLAREALGQLEVKEFSRHIIVLREGTGMMAAGGPPVVKAATGIDVTKEELGGSAIHAKASGIVDRVAKTDEEAITLARSFLSYLPTNAWSYPPVATPSEPENIDLQTVLPEDPRRPFDVKKVIRGLVDSGSFFEIKPDFARMMVTGLARIDGHPIGIVANQPMTFAGAITAAAARKARRFIDLCSAYHIPLLSLQDVPGVMTGPGGHAVP